LMVYFAYGNLVVDNVVNGRPLVYLEGVSDVAVGDAGQVILVNCDRIQVRNLNISHTGPGVELSNTNNTVISGNSITNNSEGVKLISSSSNTVSGNNITNNFYCGVVLHGSAGNNTVSDNNITNNDYYGVLLTDSSSNTVSRNNVANNHKYGVSLRNSSGNRFFHNNFIDNNQHVFTNGSTNIWDNGYPSGGNYWSDYTDVDLYSGPNQNELGSDGVWDHPYVVDANNQDHYPLINPYGHTTTEWTFAVITDLHIGRGYTNTEYTGEEYYLTKRLRDTVKWINDSAYDYNIKFLVVLGDIANSGSKLELTKAKEILNSLTIPYFPVIGNHDVWSDGEANGDSNFTDVFDNGFFITQCSRLGVVWKNDRTIEKLKPSGDSFLQNYGFEYHGINFVGLDFVKRTAISFLDRAFPCLYDSTLQWMTDNLAMNIPTILLSHHPMTIWCVPPFLPLEYATLETAFGMANAPILMNFAGHIHGWWGLPDPFMDANREYSGPKGMKVVTTEALMVGSNTPAGKGIIRIVKMGASDINDYSLVEGDFPALNPDFSYMIMPRFLQVGKTTVSFETHAFTERASQEHPILQSMAFGDNQVYGKEITNWDPQVFSHNYDKGGRYSVTLLLTWWTPDGKQKITEKITREIVVPDPWSFAVSGLSPIDLIVTDPDSLRISKQSNEIPGATYVEGDFNGDSEIEDIIGFVDRKIGDYLITVVPNSNATSTDTYTLEVLTGDTVAVLAEHVQIGSIQSLPYIVRSTDKGTIPSITASKTIVGQGFNVSINVSFINQGASPEDFNVTAYANTTAIQTINITNLQLGNNTTVTFNWDTSGFVEGNYNVSANISYVTSKNDSVNSNIVGGILKVGIPGDLNGDGTVDIYDAIKLAGAFNLDPGSLNWNPNSDINGDNIIDIYDAIILAGNYGKTA
jgi:parallel beta-helix repeat protein